MTDLPIGSTRNLRWAVDGWTPPQALAALRELEREAFGANAVPLFGDYAAENDEPRWQVGAANVYGFYELNEASRENLKARLGRRIGQLRRALDRRSRAGKADTPRLAALVRQALEVPGWGALYAVAGEPVLAGWGHMEAGRQRPLALLIGLDDGINLPGIIRSPVTAWTAAGITVALLFLAGLAAAAWAPLTWLPLSLDLPRCKVDTADLGLLDRYERERSGIDQLERQLADLKLERDRKLLACPIQIVELPKPPPPPPDPPPPPPPPPKPPEKKPDLPADKWAKKDLSILEGCWVLGKDTQTDLATGSGNVPGIVRAGRICFDKGGNGQREQVQEFPGYPRMTCRASVRAEFSGNDISTTQDPVPCEPRNLGVTWNGPPNNLRCSRRDDRTAICTDARGYSHEFRRTGS